jgi:3-carboxy-cis,cis-muconate cycloisomerase
VGIHKIRLVSEGGLVYYGAMPSTFLDSTLFKKMHTTADMRQVFSDTMTVSRYLEIERALAKVQAELGVIPQDAAQTIIEKAHLANIDIEKLGDAVPNVGVPIMALVKQLVSVTGEAGQWVHYGATTQDIMDTALVLQLRDAIRLIETDLEKIGTLLADLAREHKNSIMVGRSQLQQALPITFGYKAAVWLSMIQRHQERLEQLKPRLLVGQFSGAVGTLASLGQIGLQVQEALCRELNLAQPTISWHTARDNLGEVVCFLGLLTGSLGKIGLDIVLMAQTEVAELAEPFAPGRGGSSTMPHKRNPISAQAMMVAARAVKQQVALMLEGQMNDHERGAGIWPVEWVVLPDAFLFTSGSLNQAKMVLDGLQVNTGRMVQNLGLTRGLLVSEAVMMALAPKIGRSRAHDLLEEAVEHSIQDGLTLEQVLKKMDGVTAHLSPAEIESLTDPANYTGLASQMVDRVLNSGA